MTMQFIWQGCDSLLAAPLVLDLVRLHRVGLAAGRDGPAAVPGQFLQEPLRGRRASLRPPVPDAGGVGGGATPLTKPLEGCYSYDNSTGDRLKPALRTRTPQDKEPSWLSHTIQRTRSSAHRVVPRQSRAVGVDARGEAGSGGRPEQVRSGSRLERARSRLQTPSRRPPRPPRRQNRISNRPPSGLWLPPRRSSRPASRPSLRPLQRPVRPAARRRSHRRGEKFPGKFAELPVSDPCWPPWRPPSTSIPRPCKRA